VSIDFVTGDVAYTQSETATIGALPGKGDLDTGSAGGYFGVSNTKLTESDSTGTSYGVHAGPLSASGAYKDGHWSFAGGGSGGGPNIGVNKQITKSHTVTANLGTVFANLGASIDRTFVAPVRDSVNEWFREGFQKIYGIP
jgi:hypothetical protein